MADFAPVPLRRRTVILACAAGSLLSLLPILLMPVGGDIFFHYMLIDCFSSQFWQGDFYPRWCMDVYSGLGAPFFMFYMPLPYLVAALFHPLAQFGFSVEDVYIASLAVATFITALTCFSWLRDIVAPERALLATCVFLLFPYRMEIMYFRSAYAEAWAFAAVPLVCKYTRRLAQGKSGAVLPLTGTLAFLLLTHMACAAMVLIAGGLYLLIMSGNAWKPKMHYVAALLWSVLLAAFYLIPGAYYRRFITEPAVKASWYHWSNFYLRMSNLVPQSRAVVAIALTVLVLTVFSLYMLRCRRRIGDAFVRREVTAWVAIFAAGVFLLLPISAPLYALMGPLTDIVYPWRMQGMFMLSGTFLFAVWMQYCVTPARLKTWRNDFIMVMGMLVLMSFFLFSMRDRSYVPPSYDDRRVAEVAVVSGGGTATIEHWGWDGIILQTESTRPMTLRIRHYYFPLWQAFMDNEQRLPLSETPKSSQMLLDVPSGRHRVVLRFSLMESNPWLGLFSTLISVAAWLPYIILTMAKRRGTKSKLQYKETIKN